MSDLFLGGLTPMSSRMSVLSELTETIPEENGELAEMEFRD